MHWVARNKGVCSRQWLRCSLAALADPEERFARQFAKHIFFGQEAPKPTFRKQGLFEQQVGACILLGQHLMPTPSDRSAPFSGLIER